MTKKQFLAAISVVLVIGLAAAAAIFYFIGRSSPDTAVAATKSLSADERADIRILSSSFLQESGNFGINLDTLTEATVSQRMEDIANDNGGTSWVKRTEAASRAVSQYVDQSGGFPYDTSKIANGDYTDGNNTASFKSDSMSVEIPRTGSYVYTESNEPILTAKVSFSGTSTLSHFAQSKTGIDEDKIENDDQSTTPWDISEQSIPVSGTLTVSQEKKGADWRVRNISFQQGEFAFPFWEPSAYTTSYPGTALGGKVVRSVKFPSGEESTVAPE